MRRSELLDKWRRKKQSKEQETIQNDYYESLSAHLGIFQVILYFALFSFVVLSLIGNSGLITYRNFYYFFKDLDASAESIDVFQSDSVTYPTSDSQFFTLYRGGLAVIGTHSVTAFTATGRQTLSQSIQYRNPMAEGEGRYLLVYEMGGTQFSLYNSYTRLYSDQTEFPINGVAVSDAGAYAILSSSDAYTTVVSLYSDNFNLINRYNKNAYITDVAIDEKGKMIAMISAVPNGGTFLSRLELYAVGEQEARQTVDLGEGMAYSCSFTSTGAISVLFDDSIAFVSQGGNIIHQYQYLGESLTFAELNEDGAAILLRSSSISEKNHIIVFDKSGKILYNDDVDMEIEEIARKGNSLFLRSTSEIRKISLPDGKASSVAYHNDRRSILAVGENELLMCSPQKAEYIRFQS